MKFGKKSFSVMETTFTKKSSFVKFLKKAGEGGKRRKRC